MLKLSRLCSDNMILQRDKEASIWGRSIAGAKIDAILIGTGLSEEYTTNCDENGRFIIKMKPHAAGGCYSLKVRSGDELVEIHNVTFGDVWLCSGQSNMELPINRVYDKYKDIIDRAECDEIRTFKVIEHTNYHEEQEELDSGEWVSVEAKTIMNFSATAYFFACKYRELTGVPVGLINLSLGGSPITSWMSKDMISGYERLNNILTTYSDDEYMAQVLKTNEENMLSWHSNIDSIDEGLKNSWYSEYPVTDAHDIEVPCMFRDTELKGFIGSLWLYREFELTKEQASKDYRLWLGTMVDSDTTYVNGTVVGKTEYQYPPRKYDVPASILHEGKNSIVIRLKVESGLGRITPGKERMLFNDTEYIDVNGKWKYIVGGECEAIKPTDFTSWKPTGLYNGMTAPCHNYSVAGMIWYQGESNTHDSPENYTELTERMVEGYRKVWKDDSLVYIYAQLPNFVIDVDEEIEWPSMREAQRQCLKVRGTQMATLFDVGEDNDLHPLDKMSVGNRLALAAAHELGHYKGEYTGPVVESAVWQNGFVKVSLTHADGLCVRDIGKGSEIRDFKLEYGDGAVVDTDVTIDGNCLVIKLKSIRQLAKPVKVRYCYSNTYTGGLLYNGAGLPMAPFMEGIK